jgi:hypothetical protein
VPLAEEEITTELSNPPTAMEVTGLRQLYSSKKYLYYINNLK